ncbi:hypothetical protein [Aureivirga sp. CE67]|uniref:hypothetical protein n=1 Tax=Aureivirga sp. CE67 TaxID=1788983 RepID=UPI0018C9B9D5|nr:hypothetical protein [Aureivirga sp. CE67]
MKKYLLLFLVIFTSCKKDYKSTLETYVREDLKYKQEKIEYQLERIKLYANEEYHQYFTKEVYEEALALNKLFLDFEQKILDSKNLETTNSHLESLKKELIENYKENKYLKLEEFPKEIKNHKEKFDLLRKLKLLSYQTVYLHIGNPLKTSTGSGILLDDLAIRLNDSIVIVNFYSDHIKRGHGEDFDENSLKLYPNNENVEILYKDKNPIYSYFIKSKSDTIDVKMVLKSNDHSEYIFKNENEKIIVRDPKKLNENLNYNLETIRNQGLKDFLGKKY